jgi:hypothetical protein
MRPVSCPRAPYQRRQPEETVLYQTIAAHLPTFLSRTAGEDATGGWPAFVRREFEAYLKCGRLEYGLLRVRCERCGDTTVVAFSCRGRGFCPSCGGRRMSELAAGLVDRVLSAVPIRQWVFTVPVPVRYQLAFDAGLTRAVLRVFLCPAPADPAVRHDHKRIAVPEERGYERGFDDPSQPVATRPNPSQGSRERRN